VITIQFEQRSIVNLGEEPVEDGCLNNASLSDTNEDGPLREGRGIVLV
jgi:hypothetical protein